MSRRRELRLGEQQLFRFAGRRRPSPGAERGAPRRELVSKAPLLVSVRRAPQ
jgi:hypothetical protein